MQMNPLGRTGQTVSEMCLGTMTFGTQTPEAEAHAQIDMALGAGINFIDSAEMYPVNPISKDHAGRSEEIIGTWNAANPARRGDVILATKISGAGNKAVRDGAPISGTTIAQAVEGSLRRLQTDYIDLYQLHWPNRGSYMFRQQWTYDPSKQNRAETLAHMEDVLEALSREVEKGRIRQFGLSNESAWGTAQWLRIAAESGAPRVVTMQNEYSLLCRLYDTDMAEMSVHEDVGLIAFSPLAAGLLTGKYQGGAVPEKSRKTHVANLGGRITPRTFQAVEAYLDIAKRHGIAPVHLALAWCRTRPFMASAIFGATRLEQLEHLLGAIDVTLSEEVLGEIDRAHRLNPMPF